MADNSLQATVNGPVEETGPNQHRVVFHIEPGTRSTAVRLAFDGARGINPKLLDDIINEQNLEKTVVYRSSCR